MTAIEPYVAPAPTALLPIAAADAQEMMARYQELCRSVLTDDDTQRVGDREFVKRSGFQKLAAAYGVSTEIRRLEVDRDDDGEPVRAVAVVRASHVAGRTADGDGACTRAERGRRGSDKLEHDLRATATTRATNRAISNLIAFGSVSAEEAASDDVAPVSHGGDTGSRTWWEHPADGDELMAAADALTRIVQALGVDGPARVVQVLGNALRDTFGGSIPLAVARSYVALADLALEAPSGPPAATSAPDTGATPSETAGG